MGVWRRRNRVSGICTPPNNNFEEIPNSAGFGFKIFSKLANICAAMTQLKKDQRPPRGPIGNLPDPLNPSGRGGGGGHLYDPLWARLAWMFGVRTAGTYAPFATPLGSSKWTVIAHARGPRVRNLRRGLSSWHFWTRVVTIFNGSRQVPIARRRPQTRLSIIYGSFAVCGNERGWHIRALLRDVVLFSQNVAVYCDTQSSGGWQRWRRSCQTDVLVWNYSVFTETELTQKWVANVGFWTIFISFLIFWVKCNQFWHWSKQVLCFLSIFQTVCSYIIPSTWDCFSTSKNFIHFRHPLDQTLTH